MSREEVKKNTTIAGNGLSNSGAPIKVQTTTIRVDTTTASKNPHYGGETDSQTTLTGQGDGIPIAGGSTLSKVYGYTGASGSSIELDDTPGAETISLRHHSGAGVTIDPDGAIHITSSSRKGIGVSAPFGDAYLTASGDVVLKGSSLSVVTSGDMNMEIGGTFNLSCDGYKITTKNYDETVDGYYSSNITNDFSQTVGGIRRETIAGDKREQISGENILDVKGNNTSRVTGNNDFNVKGDNTSKIDGDNTESVTGTSNEKVGGNKVVSVGLDSIYGVSGASSFSSDGDMNIASQGTLKASGPEAIVTGDTIDINASGNADFQAGGTARVVGSTSSVGGSSVRLNTPTVLSPVITVSSGNDSPSSEDLLDGPNVESADSADEAKVMESEDIIDNMTSVREFPEYQGNARLQSADTGVISTVSYDSSPEAEAAYRKYSSKNSGTLYPVSSEDYESIPEISAPNRNTNISVIDPNISVPNRNDKSAKISRFFTLGEFFPPAANSGHRIPNSLYEQVIKNHIFVAYNVLDPIREKFPNMLITSAYRSRESSSNHVTGLAIDFVTQSRSLAVHAEMAAFARDNLPVDQVFLERNTSGRTHVHIRGTSDPNATPLTFTCGDPACSRGNRKNGIVMGFLSKKGVK